MREITEIRLTDEEFQEVRRIPEFQLGWSRDLGSVKLIRGEMADLRFSAFCAVLRKSPRSYTTVLTERTYSKEEISQAELLRLRFAKTFEPAGEECGTAYDESKSCPNCGAGRKRISPLTLNVNRVPRGVDIAKSIAWDEWVVSAKLNGLLSSERLRGVSLRPVAPCGRKGSREFFELNISTAVSLSSNSRFGIDPLNEDRGGKFVCPLGHRKGLILVSEAYVGREGWGGRDILVSAEYFGYRQGVLAPFREIFVSQRIFKLFLARGIRGFHVEVARVI